MRAVSRANAKFINNVLYPGCVARGRHQRWDPAQAWGRFHGTGSWLVPRLKYPSNPRPGELLAVSTSYFRSATAFTDDANAYRPNSGRAWAPFSLVGEGRSIWFSLEMLALASFVLVQLQVQPTSKSLYAMRERSHPTACGGTPDVPIRQKDLFNLFAAQCICTLVNVR